MSAKREVSLDEHVVAAPQKFSKRRGENVLLPFRVTTLEMGAPLPGLNYDCSAELQTMEDEERYG